MMWILCFIYTMFCVLLTQCFVFMPYKKTHKTANTLSNCKKIFAKVQNIHCTNTRFAE